MRSMKKILLLLFLSLILPLTTSADWPQWRGPQGNGVSPDTGLISDWSQDGKNLIWKADFVGRSTPIVMNGRVYVIGRTGQDVTQQEVVACFDAKDGKLLWQKKFSVYYSTVPFSR